MEIDFCPRWLLRKMGVRAQAQPHFALFLSALVILLLAPVLVRVPHLCLMQALLGVPCPGCGILHGMAALARLDIAGAWNSNPASLLVAALLAFQLVARPVALLRASTRRPITQLSSCAGRIVVTALIFVWLQRLVVGGIHGYRLLS